MSVQYELDLEKYSLQQFKRSLESRDMIPSRRSLKDELDDRFAVLKTRGILNLRELIDVLKTKQKIEQFSIETGLPIDYLILLKREANSYRSKPTRLDKFPGIPPETLKILDSVGIRNTRQLFDQAQKRKDRERLSLSTGLPIDTFTELVSLSDLSRIYGVGPVFAQMIYDVGIHSVREFVECTAEDFIRIYEEKEQKKADFGVNEIQFSLELARELDIATEI